ncbi:MAG: DUF881 domain-containing protein [Candidatus Eremiobacteraeota bacterium]|nr:DUF881 domain-containing protein [Candidatus Eremiobacteraeota bacterium]
MDSKSPHNFEVDITSKDWLEEDKKYDDSPVDTFNDKQEKDKKKKGEKAWRWSMGVACIILGIVVSLLFKTYRKEGISPTIYGPREDLAKMVKYLEKERNKLQTDLAQARKTIGDFEANSSKGKDRFSTLGKQLDLARQEAGLTTVHGPGILIKLNDSPIKPKDGDDPNFYIVHDVDLSALVNELWASGAEAVSINGQRLVMTSPIRCVGPTITVNTVRLTPPYVVKGIGPPKSLETGLRYPGGFLDSMAPNLARGVDVKINKINDMVIPGYKGSLVNRYAKPYKEEEK